MNPPPPPLFCPTIFCFSLIPTLEFMYMNVRTILSSFLHFGVMEVLVFLTVKEVLISRFDFYIVLSFSSPIFGTDVFYML